MSRPVGLMPRGHPSSYSERQLRRRIITATEAHYTLCRLFPGPMEAQMMSQADLDRLRAAFESDAPGGLEALAGLLDPQVEWFGIEQGPWNCRSQEEVLRTIRQQVPPWVDAKVEELLEADDKVMLGVRSTWPGRRQEAPFYRVLTLRRGRIIRMQDCPDRSSALQRIRGPA